VTGARAGPPWHALLAPLPPDVVPHERPVVPPELRGSPSSAAIAGWTSLVLELSAGPAGLRVLQLVLDGTGTPISASDHVLYRSDDSAGSVRAEIEQQSIGGRLEPDGSLKGTCWHVVGPEPAEGEEPAWDMTPREPTAAEIAGLRALVAELLLRRPPAAG
jgi:hypothetical protein